MKLLTRILITLPAILLQLAWMIFLVWLADGVKEIIDMIVAIVSFNYVLYIVTKKDEGSYKILWLILILAFPVPGTFLYWCYGNQKSAKPIRKRLDSAKSEIKVYSEVCSDEIINEIPIKQYDSITEIEKELNMKSNCIYKDIKRHSLIDNKYYIYLDYMLASEIDMTA